jgi:5-methyltetrahydropteroyltriglutamate--homocysteine methyltransferase
MYFANEFYESDEDYLVALADAMNEEYRAIVDAGFLLQIDDPRLITHYNRLPGLTLEECRKFIALHVEVVNHALQGIPEDRVRFHTCYSVNVAPRLHDLELKHYVDLMLKIKAQAYSIEAANPRHEHEWRVWEEVKLPPGKILIPGVVSHCVYQVEHPELVAQRIERFAGVIGRENVIAGNDCGFATSAAGDEVHPDVARLALRSLSKRAHDAAAGPARSVHGNPSVAWDLMNDVRRRSDLTTSSRTCWPINGSISASWRPRRDSGSFMASSNARRRSSTILRDARRRGEG